MLSIAKDSLKKSPNFYLYNKSFTCITSLCTKLTHHVEKIQCRKSWAENAACQPNHNTKQEVTIKSSSSHQQTMCNQQGFFTSAQRSNGEEIEQNIFDILLINLLKTNGVDKQGTFLHKTMSHLMSLKLQAIHANLEDNARLPPSMLYVNRKIDRHKKHEIPNFEVSKADKFLRENKSKAMFFSNMYTKSPALNCINAFHTSTSSRFCFDDKINKKLAAQRSFVEEEDVNFNHQHENHDDDFHFEPVNLLNDKSNNKFSPNDNKLQNDSLAEAMDSFVERTVTRRHIKRHSQTLHSASSKVDQDKGHTGKKVTISQEKLEKLYPDPKNMLNKIYSIVSTEFKDPKYMVKVKFESILSKNRSMQNLWQATYNVLWPSEMSFSAIAKSKAAASSAASFKCLQHLVSNGHLEKGVPILYGSNEVSNILNSPIRIKIRPKLIEDVNQILDRYNENIAQLLTSSETETNEVFSSQIETIDSGEDIYEGEAVSATTSYEIQASDRLLDPLRGIPLIQHSKATLDKRDMNMYQRLKTRQSDSHIDLPILKYRDDIVNQVEEQRVLVVKGEPGCGKSTQVPQFILDHFTNHGNGTKCNIIITQPRKISAISLAKRVAAERNESLGESIGYQVRLQSILPSGPSGGILFCSAGILLRRLQNNPDLVGCSHVILDEAHERDLNTDILLVLLSRALQRNPNLKLIIMSATINAGLFERYFNCNTINVPGFMHPVKMHFLEDIMRLGIRHITHQDMNLPNPYVNAEQIAKLVEWISKKKPDGAILCFLPGWSEIQKLKRELEERLNLRSHQILPIHSRLAPSDQLLIFNRPPAGVRKIILATNIAETSITIDDVKYVVDSCAHKEVRIQPDTGGCSIDNQWVSQGNVNQRKGRAGRVQPGESYHFITRDKYKSLDEFPIPEIMRVELHKAVLDCKTYTSEKAAEFFLQMPEPPKTTSVQHAVNELIEIGALNKNEDLTALGKRIALFPVDPRLSKAMVYSAIFQCINPIVTLTSIITSDVEIFTSRMYDKSPMRQIKAQFDPMSDHLALAWLFEQWNVYANQSQNIAYEFCKKNELQFGRMMMLKDLRDLFGQHVGQSRMIGMYDNWKDLRSYVNENSTNDELVRGVLLAGLGRVLQKRDKELKNGRFKRVKNAMQMQDGRRANLTADSVNYNREEWPSPYLTYQRHVHSSERRTTLIRESSIVSPLTVLLFTEGNIEARNYRKNNVETTDVLLKFQEKKNVWLICDEETADLLLNLRSSLQNVVRYLVENQGLANCDKNIGKIESFKKELVNLICKMLNDADQSEVSILQAEKE